MAMRIALCHADVRTPAQVSDKLFIRLELERLDRSGFTVNSQACLEERLVACGCLRLVAIEANTRRRDALLDGVDRWREPMNGHVKPRRNPGKSLKRLHKVSTTNDINQTLLQTSSEPNSQPKLVIWMSARNTSQTAAARNRTIQSSRIELACP